MNILIVDDSRIMRNIVKNTLEINLKINCFLLEAQDGLAALQIIERKQVDLVLLDWNMPNMNGLELLKLLREKEKYKTLPVIMVTSEAAKYNVIEAVKAGVNDYVVKPVQSAVLEKKLRRLGFCNG